MPNLDCEGIAGVRTNEFATLVGLARCERGCHCPYEIGSERDSGLMAVLVMNGDGVWIWGRGRSHIFSQTQSACSSENYQRSGLGAFGCRIGNSQSI